MRPHEAWHGWIGSQTVAEFLEGYPGMTPEEAVAHYVAEVKLSFAPDETPPQNLADLLLEYIEKNSR